MEQLKRNDSLINKDESTKKFIDDLGTKICYLNVCISSIKIEILKYEMRQIDEVELRENVANVLEKIISEVKER